MWQIFILYGCALFYIVFLTPNRYRGEGIQINIIPLITTIQRFNEQGNEPFWPYYIGYWGNILGNIILFAPFGFLFTCLYPRQRVTTILAYGLLLSTGIEITQLLLQIGVCDIDDVILNVVGTLMGVCARRFLKRWKPAWFENLQ